MTQALNPAALAALLDELELSQRELARGAGLGLGSANRLVRSGALPARRAHMRLAGLERFLAERGATPAQLAALRPAPEPESESTQSLDEEQTMLRPKQALSEAARRQFSLFANPFDGEVTRDEEMYVNGEIRFVTEVAWQAAVGGRMVAIIGESGAGKTTVLDALKEQIARQRTQIVVIEPSVEGMEDNDARGKTLKSADIHASILFTLDDKASVARGAERRSRQVRRALEESAIAGNAHLLILEEAHALPIPTLNHLKRLHEKMRLGRKPMLGILLLGHPELEKKLGRFDVREVMQRMEIARLRPLGADLSAYLTLRAQASGRPLADFITPDGIDELRSRLTLPEGPDGPRSLLYPLNVNNWMTAALNTAAALGAPKVDRDVVRTV